MHMPFCGEDRQKVEVGNVQTFFFPFIPCRHTIEHVIEFIISSPFHSGFLSLTRHSSGTSWASAGFGGRCIVVHNFPLFVYVPFLCSHLMYVYLFDVAGTCTSANLSL